MVAVVRKRGEDGAEAGKNGRGAIGVVEGAARVAAGSGVATEIRIGEKKVGASE